MNSCRIGIIARSCDKKKFLIIGEIYDENVTQDLNILLELHSNLRYLYPFKINIVNNDITIYNKEDINILCLKYKLTTQPSIINYKCKKNTKEIIKFGSPCLYDITCMKPLFIPFKRKKIPTNNLSNNTRIFIVNPYPDPILRGKLIDSCLDMIKNHKPMFILIGDKHGNNKESTSTLMSRYLLSLGVNSNIITKSLYDKFVDSIPEALTVATLTMPSDSNYDIFIACASTHMKLILSLLPKTNRKIQCICE